MWNKTSLLITVLLLSSSLGTLTNAVTQQLDYQLPTVMFYPDSHLYPLKRNLYEPLQAALSFMPESRANTYLSQAGARIVELNAMISAGKPQFTDDLVQDYDYKMDSTDVAASQIPDDARRADIYSIVQSATDKHIQVLQIVIAKAPPQAQPGLANALQKSQHEQQVAAVHVAEEHNQTSVTFSQVSVSTVNGKPTFVTQTRTVNVCEINPHAKICRTTTTTTSS